MIEDEKRVPIKPVIAIIISLMVIEVMFDAGEITKEVYDIYMKDLEDD